MFLTASEISADTLASLFDGRIWAIRVSQFLDSDLAGQLAQRFLSSSRMTHYPGTSDARTIGCWGRPFLNNSSESADAYFANAAALIIEQRALCTPYLNPVDRLRLTLDEVWGAGAGIQRLAGRLMFPGLIRRFVEGIEARPHLDRIDWAAPDAPEATGLLAQLAANVYLETSPLGGELELWSDALSPAEYGRRRLEGSYGLDRNQLPPVEVSLQPQIGELILARSDRVHAVRAPIGGNRLAMSCFIGYWGKNRPLGIWS